MIRKHSIAALLAAALSLSLCACGKPGAPSAAPAASSAAQPSASTAASSRASGAQTAGMPVRVALDGSVPPSLFAGLYAAQEQGYFAAGGLDVEAVFYTDAGTPAVDKAGDGTAQFAVCAQWGGMAEALAAAKPVTAIAALQQHSDAGLLSQADTGIVRPRALEGKFCTTAGTPVQQALFRTALEADGGSLDKVALHAAPAGTDWAMQALRGGAPAVSAVYGWDGLLCKENGMTVNFQFYADVNPTLDAYPALLAANRTFLEAHPEETKAFLHAAHLGYTYAAQHPDLSAAAVAQHVPSANQQTAAIQRSLTWLAGKYRDDAPYWGALDANRWNAFYTWFNEQKLTAAPVPLDTGLTDEYLPQNGERESSE